VRRVAARRVVAAVAHVHALGDGAVRFHPGQAMSAARVALPRKPAVPSRASVAFPRPAGIRSTRPVGFAVEPLGERPVLGAVETFRGLGSHLIAVLSQSLVRARTVLVARSWPAFSSKNCAWGAA
jgi:hypothetical protein